MDLRRFIDGLTNTDRYNVVRVVLENLRQLGRDEFGRLMYRTFEFAAEMRIGGDYLEFGCYSGFTMTWAYKAVRHHGLRDLRFFAFDSFAGLPPIEGVDAEYPEFQQGQFSSDERGFLQDLRAGGVDLGRVITVPGWYSDSLTEATHGRLGIERAAVVLVDCDLYASTVPVLEFVTRYLVDGSVLVFDDWRCFRGSPEHGEQRACREWLAAHPEIRLSPFEAFETFGQSFIVHRPSRT